MLGSGPPLGRGSPDRELVHVRAAGSSTDGPFRAASRSGRRAGNTAPSRSDSQRQLVRSP